MRWQGQAGSENVEDRRGMKGPVALGGGGILIIVIGAIIAFLNGAQPQQIALALDEWQPALTPGDTILDVHIPSGGQMTLQSWVR